MSFNFGKKIYIQRRIVIRHFFRSFVRELRVGAGQRSTRFRTKGCTANDGHLHYQMQFFTRIPNMYILIALKEVSKCMLRPFFCPSKPNIAHYHHDRHESKQCFFARIRRINRGKRIISAHGFSFSLSLSNFANRRRPSSEPD